MHILRFVIFEECRRGDRLLPDLIQALQDGDKFQRFSAHARAPHWP